MEEFEVLMVEIPPVLPSTVIRNAWLNENKTLLLSFFNSLLNSTVTLGAPIRNQETKHPTSSKHEGFSATSQSCTRAGPGRTARTTQRSDTRAFAFIFACFRPRFALRTEDEGRARAQSCAAPAGLSPPKPSRHCGRSRRFRVPCRAVPCLRLDSQFRGGRGSRCSPGPARPSLQPRPRPSEPRMDFLPLLLLYLCLVLAVAVLYCSHAGSGGGRLGRAARSAGQVRAEHGGGLRSGAAGRGWGNSFTLRRCCQGRDKAVIELVQFMRV